MLRVALKGLLGHKLRFILTTLAVVLGITFVAGAFVLTDTMEQAFDDLFETAYGDADVWVRASTSFEISAAQFQAGGAPTMDEGVVTELAAIDGVAQVDGEVEGSAYFVAPDGEPILTTGAPTLAFSWTEGGNVLSLRSGREPRAADEVTMDAGTFERHGFAVGDTVEVITPQGVRSFELTGVTGFGDGDNLLGATIATFELATAQELFEKEGQLDTVAVAGDGSLDAEALRDRIDAELGAGFSVTTTTDQVAADSADVSEALGFLTTALLAFAGIALFVGSFLIVNTFSIVVAQRAREFALLRAVGASRSQVRTAVMVEAAVVGVLASTIGLLLGIGFARVLPVMLAAGGVELPTGDQVVAARTVVAAYVVGIGVTMLASILPARRASRVAPVEAMRGAATAAAASLTRRTIGGAALTVLGAVLLLVGLAGAAPQTLAAVGLGAALAFIGVTLLAPMLADPLARVLGALPARFSVAGKIARGNARRDPRRTSSTAAALMIGLALVSAVSILAASLQAAVSDALTDQLRADFIVQGGGFQPLSPTVARTLADDPAIGSSTPIRLMQASDGEGVITVVGIDGTVVEELMSLGITAGDLGGLGTDGIALQDEVAEERGLGLGDVLELTMRDGTAASFAVRAIFESYELVGSQYVVSLESIATYGGGGSADLAVLADAADDLEAGRAAVEAVLAGSPGAEVRDQAEFRQQQEDQIAGLLNLMLVLLALAIIIALLGITNTLALAVLERTREIGLLRAVGMERRQTRRMVLWESVIVAAFGTALGLAVGTFLGWALVQALADEGVSRMVMPGGQLATYAIFAIIAGVIAAFFPAWRASRLDVLEAVTVE